MCWAARVSRMSAAGSFVVACTSGLAVASGCRTPDAVETFRGPRSLRSSRTETSDRRPRGEGGRGWRRLCRWAGSCNSGLSIQSVRQFVHRRTQVTLLRTIPAPDIIATLAASTQFRTWTTILVRTLFVDDLREPGPWFLLCPTDEAFDQLPKGVLNRIFAPSRVEQLIDLAERHITRSAWPSMPQRRVHDKARHVNGANVVAQRRCSNGMLTIIDRVLVTPTSVPTAGPRVVYLARSSASALDPAAPPHRAVPGTVGRLGGDARAC